MSRAFVRDADAGIVERVEMHVAGRTVPGFAISGSPVMAVTHAVLELAERPIGLCISGINYGENIGGSIAVSGTVGAALEAEAYGIPSIAVAITAQVSEWRTFGAVDWTAARHFTRRLAEAGPRRGHAGRSVGAQPQRAQEARPPRRSCARRCRAASPTTSAAAASSGRRLDEPYQFAVKAVVDWDRLEPGTDIPAVNFAARVSGKMPPGRR